LEPDALFLPLRTGTGIDATKGFIRSSTRDGTRLWYTWSRMNGANVEYVSVPDDKAWSVSIPDTYPEYPKCQIQTLISGSAFVDLQFDPAKSGAWLLSVNPTADPPEMNTPMPYDFAFTMPVLPISITGYLTTLGGNIFPIGTGIPDRFYCLVQAASGCWEVQFQITAAALTYDSRASISLPFLAGPPVVERCMYFHDPIMQRSFAEALVDGAWQCVEWSTNPVGTPVLLPEITRRIDALLSTGELFSTDGGIGTVYAPDGTVKTTFPLGALRYVLETYMDGSPRLIFSLRTGTQESPVFYLYSIPTEELAALK
jgi:hypothetical protein